MKILLNGVYNQLLAHLITAASEDLLRCLLQRMTPPLLGCLETAPPERGSGSETTNCVETVHSGRGYVSETRGYEESVHSAKKL